MSSAAAPPPRTAERPLTVRARPALVVALVALAAVGWALLGRVEAPMAADGGAFAPALAAYTGVWVLMIAAMVFPSTAPMVAMYERIAAARRGDGRRAPRALTSAFVAGYVPSSAA